MEAPGQLPSLPPLNSALLIKVIWTYERLEVATLADCLLVKTALSYFSCCSFSIPVLPL